MTHPTASSMTVARGFMERHATDIVHSGWAPVASDLAILLDAAEARGRARGLEEAERCVPTTWLDDLLTGPQRVVNDHVDCPSIERLLNAVRKRIRTLKDTKP